MTHKEDGATREDMGRVSSNWFTSEANAMYDVFPKIDVRTPFIIYILFLKVKFNDEKDENGCSSGLLPFSLFFVTFLSFFRVLCCSYTVSGI